MAEFKATIKNSDSRGEITMWTYVTIPSKIAQAINPDTKKSFRVKGTIDTTPIKQKALVPSGNGNYILALNAGLRKKLNKQVGNSITLNLSHDTSELIINQDLLNSLEHFPKALSNFNKMSKGHQKYFSDWINQAKTSPTKTKRIGETIEAMELGLNYNQYLAYKKDRSS